MGDKFNIWSDCSQQQQLQAQHLSHGHGLPVPLTPHPSGLQPPAIPPIGSSAGLLALSSALGGQSHLPIKDEKKHHDNDHQRGEPRAWGVRLELPHAEGFVPDVIGLGSISEFSFASAHAVGLCSKAES